MKAAGLTGARIERIYSQKPKENTTFFEIDTDSAGYRFSTVLYFVTDRGLFSLTPQLELTKIEKLPENLCNVSIMFPDIVGSVICEIGISDAAIEIKTSEKVKFKK